jgi:hypothetical protein
VQYGEVPAPNAFSFFLQFDIVCDKVILRSVTNMLFMFFKIFGGIVGGQISDRYDKEKFKLKELGFV